MSTPPRSKRIPGFNHENHMRAQMDPGKARRNRPSNDPELMESKVLFVSPEWAAYERELAIQRNMAANPQNYMDQPSKPTRRKAPRIGRRKPKSRVYNENNVPMFEGGRRRTKRRTTRRRRL